MILPRRRIRIAADASKPPDYQAKDLMSGSSLPAIWRGNDIQFEIAVFASDALVDDISNIASLTVRILAGSAASSAELVSHTLTAAELNGALTNEQWLAKTHQHALVPFTGAETSPALGGVPSKQFWTVVSVTTNDNPGHEVTLCATLLTIYEDGNGSEILTPDAGTLYYPRPESDARFVQRHEDLAFSRFQNGRWEHYIAETDNWYPEVAIIKDGVPILTLGQGVGADL